jgi:uncharacterized pyridoxamine 5'-phosphate oxidase family protein
MHETPEDMRRLQDLLDRSYEAAGNHLKSIVTPERRVDGERLVEQLRGVQILALATVTGDCRPLVGPVDGLFYRGEFWFGSSNESVRFAHLRSRPSVSATHVRGESFAVTVHGRAEEVELEAPEHAGFRAYCVETYGDAWNDWAGNAPYARIRADKLYSFEFEARPDE